MEYFLQQLINGLTLGAIYGLIAIGYTMVYGIIGMINFAHGEIYMIGAFIALISIMLLQSVAGGSAIVALFRPLRRSPRLAALISAIGMSIALGNYVQLTQGARNKTLQPIIQGSIELMRRDDGFTVVLSYIQIGIIATTIVLMIAFSMLITRTSLGRAQRACEQDRTMAALLGVNVDRTISLTFVMGAALAAVAGFLVVLYYGVIDFFIGFLAGIKAFTAAVLGGIGSIPGAMLGGLLIGLIEAF
ncbi:MAG: branched-chain amino acid ABC transporter permease LivH, partial [Alphaproteobacteria bacterium]|nr:branched-chain amino acid ABC transporter permease LivH [Alphaproteobacteria bacterium]